jgi:large subunit ribosomal protein L18
MAKIKTRQERRLWKKIRIRKRLSGTAARPRLAVFKSLKYITVQAIDDDAGTTLAAATTREKDLATLSAKERPTALGKEMAVRLKAKGIDSVVFDRGGYLFHGRVKAVADGARAGGLKF